MRLTTHFHPVPSFRTGGSIPLHAFMTCKRTTFLLYDTVWTVCVYTGVHKLSCSYVTRCVTATTKFHHWTLFHDVTSVHIPTFCFPKFYHNVIVLFTYCFPHGLFPWGFPTIFLSLVRLPYEPTSQFFFVMCHVWNITSIYVFVFITEVLITKYKS